MSRRSILFLPLVIITASVIWAQAPAVRPTEQLQPIIVPWEPGGPENHLHTQEQDDAPFPGHRIIANVYYVGATDYVSYLITSPQGHILIDTGFESTVPKIQKNVEQLGFKFQDIKILLLTHGHIDHCEGAALVKKLTGAQLMVMDGDAESVNTGGANHSGEGGYKIPPAKVDRILHDKNQITLGGNALTAYKCPGHSPGNTTYVWTVQDGGKSYVINIMASLTASNVAALATNPDLLDEYRYTYKLLKSLPCDIFLGHHGKFFGLREKYARLQKGGPNPYIDPEGYKAHIQLMERNLYYKMDWAIRQTNLRK